MDKPLKPAQFAEKKILQIIMDGSVKPGKALPSERSLAMQIGVTRPTLREALQRLSRDGWVTINHGKSTIVNNYLEDGGLGILEAIIKCRNTIPSELIFHLLEARAAIFPDIARKAVENHRESVISFLEGFSFIKDEPCEFAGYDCDLQMLMVKKSGNPVFNMIFNDFMPVCAILGEKYFSSENARIASMKYYETLICALKDNVPDIRPIVRNAMVKACEIWKLHDLKDGYNGHSGFK